MNPFKSVLFAAFSREKDAVAHQAGAEQLVWVLWKILKDEGGEFGVHSSNELAASSPPANLRAPELTLDETLYHIGSDFDEVAYAYQSQKRAPAVLDGPDRSEDDELTRLLHAARTRALSLAEQRHLTPLLPLLAASPDLAPADLTALVPHNPALAHALFRARLASPSAAAPAAHRASESALAEHLDALAALPPTLPALDVLGRLLRDPDPAVSSYVRSEALSAFLSRAVDWVARAERAEGEGGVSDDRAAQGVQHLCRFYAALMRLGLADDADSAAMMHFSLRHARFADANALYRMLVAGRGE